jgi:hypothetical protein
MSVLLLSNNLAFGLGEVRMALPWPSSPDFGGCKDDLVASMRRFKTFL